MAATKTLPSSTFRDVLKRSFQITKRHKFLWFFGFFAAFLGVGGDFEPLFTNYTKITETSQGIFSLQSFYQEGILSSLVNNAKLFFSTYPAQAFLFLLMVFVVTIILIWLAIISQIALFDAANKLSKNKEASYSDGYKVGNKHFGSVLLINILVKIIVYGLFTVIGAPLLSWFLLGGSTWGAVIFALIVFFLLIPASIIISFIVKYAVAYIVIKGKRTGEAVRLGWDLFKKNWLVSIEMAFVILIIGVCMGLVIALAIVLAAVPFVLIGIAALFFGSSAGFTIAAVLGTVVWFVITAIIGAAYVAYQYTAWTLLFLKLVENKAQSKLMRWFGKLAPNKS